MQKYNWNYPTTMWVGQNRIKDLGNACKNLNIKKPLLVTDQGLARSEIILSALNDLNDEGISVQLYSNVVGNPTGTNVNEGVDHYKKNNCDGVIAFGGGSGLDVGKAIAFMSGQNLPLWDFEDVGDNWTRANSAKIAPIIAVPTTAGTGSEVTPFATVWDYGSKQKKSLSHPVMYAKKAFIDPDFLSQVPLEVAISTGFDALNQAFESIWNVNANEFTRPLSRRAAVMALQSLPAITEVFSDPELRAKLALASLFAGLAISQTRTSICHSISYPLTLKYGIEHGIACAFSMIEVYKYNMSSVKEDIRAIEFELGKDAFDTLNYIFSKYNINSRIASSLPNKSSFSSSIEDFITAGRFDNNIKKCDRVDLVNIITTSYDMAVK